MKVSIIIPVLNPTSRLVTLTNELIKNKFNDIVVVDDGSTNDYKSIYKKLNKNIRIKYHSVNLGKGAAIKTGIKNIKTDAYITVDADLQHSVNDIIKIREELKNNDVVIGQRNFSLDNVPFKSKFGNKFSSIMYALKTRKKCTDTQSGLRGINIKYKKEMLNIKGNRYDYEMNQLFYFAKNNIDVKYINMETIYEKGNPTSHFNALKDSYLVHKEFFIILILIIITLIIVVKTLYK